MQTTEEFTTTFDDFIAGHISGLSTESGEATDEGVVPKYSLLVIDDSTDLYRVWVPADIAAGTPIAGILQEETDTTGGGITVRVWASGCFFIHLIPELATRPFETIRKIAVTTKFKFVDKSVNNET